MSALRFRHHFSGGQPDRLSLQDVVELILVRDQRPPDLGLQQPGGFLRHCTAASWAYRAACI